MDRTEARELLQRVRTCLAQSPLPVSVHVWRNAVGAALAVITAVAPYFLLQSEFFKSMFIVPLSALTANVPEATWSYLAVFTGKWPFAEIPVLGWLFLPSVCVWYSVALERATDGKLASTLASELEHLEHEAHTAEAAMGNINQPPEVAKKIAKTLKSLEPKQRLVRRAFLVHRHDLGWVCLWPWLIASTVMSVALVYVTVYRGSYGASDILPLWNLASILCGGFVVYLTTILKSIRSYRMQTSWNFIGFIRDAVQSAGAGGGTF